MATAKELYNEVFSFPRDPRSPEYKAGVLEAIKYRLGEISTCNLPYAAGTSQSDAFFAGLQEGHSRGSDYLSSRHNKRQKRIF